MNSRFVRVITSRDESTCFYIATDRQIPSAEVVASALLELKNNPGLFEKWRKRRGCTFKANGRCSVIYTELFANAGAIEAIRL